ncbi:MAG TPA: glycosyltransferase family 1 protein, partial [Bacteroidia bacterium]|nr:glycosyltransferase family 1 protein [Bacteroidia bacterium]
MENSLHIVSFDVPFPANYGGVIDVFYKLVNLYKAGIKITLHCYEYGRGEQKELEKYCQKVYYYKRKTSFLKQLSPVPYIIKSRTSE